MAGDAPKIALFGARTTPSRCVPPREAWTREMVEMHYLLTEPLIMDGSALQRLIGPIAKTPYAEGIRQTICFHDAAPWWQR